MREWTKGTTPHNLKPGSYGLPLRLLLLLAAFWFGFGLQTLMGSSNTISTKSPSSVGSWPRTPERSLSWRQRSVEPTRTGLTWKPESDNSVNRRHTGPVE